MPLIGIEVSLRVGDLSIDGLGYGYGHVLIQLAVVYGDLRLCWYLVKLESPVLGVQDEVVNETLGALSERLNSLGFNVLPYPRKRKHWVLFPFWD